MLPKVFQSLLLAIRLLPIALFSLVLSGNAAASNLPGCKGDYFSVAWHNCFGIVQFPNGSRYAGEFRESKFHGRGLINLTNGDQYDGEWRNGVQHGRGIYTPAGGSFRSGFWQNGKYVGAIAPAGLSPSNATPASASSNRVRMVQSGGTFKVPVRLNDQLTLDFTVDSGASVVTVPADVVLTLIRTNTIRDSDFRGEQVYVLADGSRVKSRNFILRTLAVGDITIENVEATIVDVKGSLLLGQSLLRRFKSWSIDNTTQELVLQ